MAVLSWGKPKIEFAQSVNGAPSGAWTEFPEVKEDSSKLTPTKGTKKEATEEGGDTVDVRYGKNKYTFEMDVFVKKGDSKPIEDDNGVISGNYALRLTPEDAECEGFMMENCTVSCEESYSAADGKIWKYTFDGKKPATGNILKPYVANSLTVTPSALYFSNAVDDTGKTITATSTGDASATSSESWATVTCAAKVATVKVTANDTGSLRTAVITVTADSKTAHVTVTQIPA